ncbi:MAG: hypothetical protein IJS00_04695 [Paludibacteraceae bacterium]|nr:hypothetical protein [Paludibacteraceae bacterium]
MKRNMYINPATEVVKVEMEAILFPPSAGTPEPSPARRDVITYAPNK